jgi:hypothetical protein
MHARPATALQLQELAPDDAPRITIHQTERWMERGVKLGASTKRRREISVLVFQKRERFQFFLGNKAKAGTEPASAYRIISSTTATAADPPLFHLSPLRRPAFRFRFPADRFGDPWPIHTAAAAAATPSTSRKPRI